MRSLPRRLALYLGGIAFSTFCYAVTIRADLGLGPLFVVQDGVHRMLGVSVGTAVTIVGVVIVALSLALRYVPRPGTFALPFVGGAMMDLILPHVPEIDGLVWRLGLCVAASWCITLGGAMLIRADIGIAAIDGVMMGLHRILGWPIGPLRLVMEATMIGVGWLLGGSVGVGTVVMGALIGHGLQFWLRLLGGVPHRGGEPLPDVAVA